MGLRVNTNVASINAQRNLSNRHGPPEQQLPPPVDGPPHLDRGRRRRRPRDLRAPALADPLARAGEAQRQRRHLARARPRKARSTRQQHPGAPARAVDPGGQRHGQPNRTARRSTRSSTAWSARSTASAGRPSSTTSSCSTAASSSVSFQVGFGTTAGIDTISVSALRRARDLAQPQRRSTSARTGSTVVRDHQRSTPRSTRSRSPARLARRGPEPPRQSTINNLSRSRRREPERREQPHPRRRRRLRDRGADPQLDPAAGQHLGLGPGQRPAAVGPVAARLIEETPRGARPPASPRPARDAVPSPFARGDGATHGARAPRAITRAPRGGEPRVGDATTHVAAARRSLSANGRRSVPSARAGLTRSARRRAVSCRA
jgi:hypothetical protein